MMWVWNRDDDHVVAGSAAVLQQMVTYILVL
jgi:hypothetical protein